MTIELTPNVLRILSITSLSILCIALYCVSQQQSNESLNDNCVKNLKKPQIEEENAHNQYPQLLLYYTNWCGFSREFLPEWEKVKEQILNKNIIIKCKEYNCALEKQQCDKNNIRGYPSIILHKSDTSAIIYPDDKPRNVEHIIAFVTKEIQTK